MAGLLGDFRAAVAAVLRDKLPTPFALWDVVPDDVAELPCVVLTRPGAAPTSTAVVYDLALDLFVLGRRQQAGGSEDELVALADDVWTVLGGTRGVAQGDYHISAERIDPRVTTIAGLEIPSYVITVVSSAATC